MSRVIERFAFTFAPDPAGLVRFQDQTPGERKCKMRFLLGGEPVIGDYRKFRMLPEDAALCVGNAKKRISMQSKGAIPLLFEHGWGAEGGRAGGYALDVYEEGGDIWFTVLLDEPTWAAAVDPGLNWFGRSAYFSGWMDPDGFIRPADIFEGSLTNFPAMQGLGECQPMQELEEKFSKRIHLAMKRQYGLDMPEQFTPGTTSHTSPAEASYRKEREQMKLSAETLKLLGFAENADPTPEQIDNAVKAKQGAAAPAASVSVRSEVLQVMDELRARDREEIGAQLRAEFEARDKERAIDAVLLDAEKSGRITVADREKYRAMGRQMGAEALKDVVSRFAAVAPTGRVFEPGSSAGAPVQAGSQTIAELCEQENAHLRSERMSTWARRYAAEKGITAEQASERLRAHASSAVEVN